MHGPDSWAGRPRDVETFPVSNLKPELRELFKKTHGRRRWTTPTEIERLRELQEHQKREKTHGRPGVQSSGKPDA